MSNTDTVAGRPISGGPIVLINHRDGGMIDGSIQRNGSKGVVERNLKVHQVCMCRINKKDRQDSQEYRSSDEGGN